MSQRYRVGVTADFKTFNAGVIEPALRELFDPLPQVAYDFMPELRREVTPDQLCGYDAVISLGVRYTADTFQEVESLAVIARWGVGYDMIDVSACTESDLLVAITTDAVRRPVAEAILALMLALARRIPLKDQQVRTGRWDLRATSPGVGLRGKAVGSVGLGNIASEMFHLLRPFGLARMWAYDPYVGQDKAHDMGIELVDLPALFRMSDFIAVNCPLNEETRGMIDRDLLSLMRPTAYLINTARGAIVKQADLVAGLEAGNIAGAGLDVFEQEPLAADDPLTRLDNVILAPHSLAFTDCMYRDTAREACHNVLTVLRGEVPPHVVNREVIERPGFRAKSRSLKDRWAPPA